ncbi:MAG: OB-fold domain-containing protein, partial [Firmicutes bacterium]|nr:OB-fold domain-containing protein [Bacillota bacterium]
QVCYQKFLGAPEPPWASGLVRLDGADTAMLHFIGGVDLTDINKARELIKIGTRVRAVWNEERKGIITDIRHFKPVNLP